MNQLFLQGSAWTQLWIYSIILFARYWLIAGGFHFVAWKWGEKRLAARHIQKTPPASSSMKREMSWSMITIPIFGATAFFMVWASQWGWISVDISPFNWHGLGRAFLYFVGFLLLHDFYFYWVHRLMHHPRLYRRVHAVHHQSTNPSAFAAFSFHPIESVIEVLFFPLAVLALPGAPILVIAFFFTFDFATNTLAHTGVEYLPRWFRESWVGQWVNTATNHNLHHQRFQGNYGFYFTFWDRLCGTLVGL